MHNCGNQCSTTFNQPWTPVRHSRLRLTQSCLVIYRIWQCRQSVVNRPTITGVRLGIYRVWQIWICNGFWCCLFQNAKNRKAAAITVLINFWQLKVFWNYWYHFVRVGWINKSVKKIHNEMLRKCQKSWENTFLPHPVEWDPVVCCTHW